MKIHILLFLSLLFSQINAQHNWKMTNPGGGGAIAMLGATKNGDIVAASDLSGVYITQNNGKSWKVLGAVQGLTETHISSFGFHPTNGKTFIIGTAIGAFKTQNSGENIYPVQIEVDPDKGLGYVESIGMAISDSTIGYMAHYEWWEPTLSILKTTDSGESWKKIHITGIPTEARIIKIIVDAHDSKLVYALAGKARFACSLPKLYKSSNGGKNWSEIGTEFPAILDIDLHPTNPNIIYISTFEANDCDTELWNYVGGDEYSGNLYKSIDGGSSFTQLSQHTGIISVGDDPNNISLIGIFNLDSWNENAGTWSTKDGGQTWEHSGYIQNWNIGWANKSYAFTFSFNGLSKTLTKNRFNPKNLNGSFGQWGWSSIDGGVTLNNITSSEISPDHWLSNGLENIQGNAIEVSDKNTSIVYAGFYDLGFWYSKNGGESWKWSLPDYNTYPEYVWWNGGGSNCNFVVNDPDRENVIWATFGADNYSTKGAIFKSTEHGENWKISNTGLNPLGLNTHGLSIDLNSPINNRTLFVTQNGDVFKSTDDGNSWIKVFTNGGVKFTEVSKTNGLIVYAGGENGLFKSIDGGDTWGKIATEQAFEFSTEIQNAIMRDDIVPTYNELEENPPIVAWKGVFDIKTDYIHPDRVFVSVYGENKGLYRSNDGGNTWEKKYGNDKMRGIAIAKQNSNVIYIGSSLNYHSGGFDTEQSKGILVSYDAGETWASANDGMAWSNGGRIDIDATTTPKVWAWSPGTGLQYAKIPNFKPLSINNYYNKNDITIYPNPTSKFMLIDTKNQIIENIKVYNQSGSLVLDKNFPDSKINISNFPKGVYNILIRIDNKISYQKIVLE